MTHTILRRSEVEKRLGIPKSSLYAMVTNGKFPKPIKLNDRSSGWVSTEIDQWIEARIAERDAS